MGIPDHMLDDTGVALALDAAAGLGAADAEVVLSRSVGLDVGVANGEVETFGVAESVGAGVRVFTSDRRMGFAYTSEVTDGLEALIRSAWENAQPGHPDEHNVLPDECAVSDEDWREQGFEDVRTEDKVGFARRLEERTLAADARMTRVRAAEYGEVSFESMIANSRGMKRRFRSAYCSCSVMAAAGGPGLDEESGWEFDLGRRLDELDLESVATQCADKAVRLLGARPCETRAMPVLLDNRIASAFLSVLCPAMLASSVLKGKSFLKGRVGEAVAGARVTVVDRNDDALGLNPRPFDGEGVSAQTTTLIDSGTLRGYLHNAYTAAKMGTATTANAVRAGHRSTPEVGASNCRLEPGGYTQEQLAGMMDAGLFVTAAMGVHTADPISGEFSFGAAGLTVEKGRFGRPVRGVTISGNLRDLFQKIQAVGNDLRFFSSCGAPSVLVGEMMVSGT